MEEEAKRRKEKLAALKKKALGSKVIEEENNNEAQRDVNAVEEKPKLKFRNFEPTTELLLERSGRKQSETKEGESEETTEKASLKRVAENDRTELTVEEAVKGLTEDVIAQQKEKLGEEVDLTNLAPTKPNADLKRDLQNKLSKLEYRTQIRIHEIVRERIKSQSLNGKNKESSLNLNDAINTQEKMNKEEMDEDD